MYYYLINKEAVLAVERDLTPVANLLSIRHKDRKVRLLNKRNHSIAFKMEDEVYGMHVNGGDWVDIPTSNLVYEVLEPALLSQGFKGDIKELPGSWVLRIHFTGLLEQKTLEAAV